MTSWLAVSGGSNFVVVTTTAIAPKLKEQLKARFNAEVLKFYSALDREHGYILAKNSKGDERQVPLMRLAIGAATAD